MYLELLQLTKGTKKWHHTNMIKYNNKDRAFDGVSLFIVE